MAGIMSFITSGILWLLHTPARVKPSQKTIVTTLIIAIVRLHTCLKCWQEALSQDIFASHASINQRRDQITSCHLQSADPSGVAP